MDEYVKIGKVADQFGINAQTIRNWVDDERFQEFFSEGAKSDVDKRSLFNESDIIVINTIWTLSRGRKHSLDQVSDMLRAGHRETVAPERAAIVATMTNPAIQMAGRMMSAEDRLTLVLQQLTQVQDQLIRAEREHSEKLETLLREMAELRALEASAKREIELYEEGRLKPGKSRRAGQ